ncbi:hypothetical protein [Pseudomonas sp.]|uniref:hypothetical protein n=1 Tax=Pseudomonas sp. TaxID=306 RepID=UPI00356A9FC4
MHLQQPAMPGVFAACRLGKWLLAIIDNGTTARAREDFFANWQFFLIKQILWMARSLRFAIVTVISG